MKEDLAWASAPIPHNAAQLHLSRSRFSTKLINFICGCEMNDIERQKYPQLAQHKLRSLPSFDDLFKLDGFFINSIMFGGGSTISAYCCKREKKTITVMLKNGTVSLETIYGSPEDRQHNQKHAQDKTKSRSGKSRIPVAKVRGIVTEKRFVENSQKYQENISKISFIKEHPPDEEHIEQPPDHAEEPTFSLLLELNKLSSQSSRILHWLLKHPLVALDPGLRWVVCGIIAILVSYTIDGNQMTLRFKFRRIRISGKQFACYDDPYADVPELVESFSDTLKKLASLSLDEQKKQMKGILEDPNIEMKMEQTIRMMTDDDRVRRKEERIRRQRNIALNFCRKISSMCSCYGDPVIIYGNAGGGGGHGRRQVNHALLLHTIAGFFSVMMLNEFNTSKLSDCCHNTNFTTDARYRSRKCRKCTGHWDRDMGASW